MSLPLGLFILLSVFVTSLISGAIGMAGGMILMGLLTWVLPVQQTMVLHATAQFFANASRAWIHRKHIHLASTKYYLAGLAVTLAVFCVVAFVPDKMLVFTLLGIGPFIPLVFKRRMKLDFTKPWQAFVCGAGVTGFQLTGGVAGPVVDMFFQKIAMTRHQVVATKSFTQTMSHTVKFVYFGAIVPAVAAHDTQWLPWWIYAAVIPVAIFGSNAAQHILNRMTDHQFYKITQVLLYTIGTVYLAKAASLALH